MKTRIFLHIVFLLFSLSGYTQISGIVNIYASVSRIYASVKTNVDSVVVNNLTGFKAGDTVVIIQMQGAKDSLINKTESTVIGYGPCGNFEFIIINKIIDSLVIFKNPLINNYVDSDKVQLIKVASYASAFISSADSIQAKSWDGSTGGVLAIAVNDTFRIDGIISAKNKGFRGSPATGSYKIKCGNNNVAYFKESYPSNAHDTAGLKGEGIEIADSGFIRGRGNIMNGGGGGCGYNSGGGGGGSYGEGGSGGFEPAICQDTLPTDSDRAEGGRYIYPLYSGLRAFLGGGGGAGVYDKDSLLIPSNGGNGGGLIFILADVITGTGTIIADGASINDTTTACGGGGGGGGSIFIDADTILKNITASVRGGNGGSTTGIFNNWAGPGGGGGAGLISCSQSFSNLKEDTTFGKEGFQESPNKGANSGGKGHSNGTLAFKLNGFLFNYLSENQQICVGDKPNPIIGSIPKGKDKFSYSWASSMDLMNWKSIASTKDYQPTSLDTTTYFRRIVTSDTIIDTSLVCIIQVYPAINNNSISAMDSVCEGSMTIVTGTTPAGGINNFSFSYSWIQSINYVSWNNINQYSDSITIPTTNDSIIYLKRIVTRGSGGFCNDTSKAIQVTVLSSIQNNFILADTTVCANQKVEPLKGKVNPITGGNNIYAYNWQYSSDDTTWTDLGGITPSYDPGSLSNSQFYRRIISSYDCKDTSNTVEIIILPPVTNNIILPMDTTVCKDDSIRITGSIPLGGSNTYSYQWLYSQDRVKIDSITSGNLINITTRELDSTYFYKRIVYSGYFNTCKDTSPAIRINIYKPASLTLINMDSSICAGDSERISLQFNGRLPWSLNYKMGADSFNYSNINSSVFSFSKQLSDNSSFGVVWIADSLGCFSRPELKDTIKVYQITRPYMDPDTSVCGIILNMIMPKPDSLLQSTSKCILYTSISDVIDTIVSIPFQKYGSDTLVWFVNNHGCKGSDSMMVMTWQIPSSIKTTGDTTFPYTNTIVLSAGQLTTGQLLWTTPMSDVNILHPEDTVTEVLNVKPGINKFRWTVSNGVCPVKQDSIIIYIKELTIPGGFSPNGDGKNDYFEIIRIDDLQNMELQVFNRWGIEVYHSADYKNNWDGKSNGTPLPDDTYFYIMKYNDIIYKGSVTIRR